MHKIYSIYDVKAKVFNQPFFVLNDDIAVRMCSNLVNDPTSQIALHPEDYVLYRLGEFNDASGEIIGLQSNHEVITKINALIDKRVSERLATLRQQPEEVAE